MLSGGLFEVAHARARQIAEVVRLRAVRQAAQVFAAVAACDRHAADAALLGERDALGLGEDRAVRKLVAGDFAVVADQLGNAFGVFIRDRVHDVDVCGQIADFLAHFGHSFLRGFSFS